MKQGSGDDPFADLDDEDGEGDDSGVESQGSEVDEAGSPASSDEAGSSTTERYTDSGGSGSVESTADADAEMGGSSRETSEKEDVTDDEDGMSKAEADGIPWVLRRSRVKEDRENVHQFFLREEYSTREDEILEAVAGELDMRQKDLQKLDVREAMVASADPEAIADVLREWGYEYLK